MITFDNVTKEYWLGRKHSVKALKDIHFTIKRGEFISIIGASGSGKSTLLALASLLDKPTTGEIFIDGKKTSTLSDKQRTNLRYDLCGFIFQFSSLVAALPVLDNVMLPLMLRGEKQVSLERRAVRLLAEVGISKRKAYQMPYQLSGGEQRRVAVARALLKEPPLLFADEPTSALDDETAKDLIQLFHQLNEKGTTILMVTHDKQLANEGTGIFEIKSGKLNNITEKWIKKESVRKQLIINEQLKNTYGN